MAQEIGSRDGPVMGEDLAGNEVGGHLSRRLLSVEIAETAQLNNGRASYCL